MLLEGDARHGWPPGPRYLGGEIGHAAEVARPYLSVCAFSTGPGSRTMAWRAAAANRGDHSPGPARACAACNSSRVDHNGCLSWRKAGYSRGTPIGKGWQPCG